MSSVNSFIKGIKTHIKERGKHQIPQLPLNLSYVQELIHIFNNRDYSQEHKPFLLHMLKNKIVPGVDDTSKLKAEYLYDVCKRQSYNDIVTPSEAIKLLGTMQGGYNVNILTSLLDDERYQKEAYMQLKHILLIFDSYHDIENKYKNGNIYAEKLLDSWAQGEWFLSKPKLNDKITLCVFKVPGETNTDDLSPAQDAWSRPDIPLHARSMLKTPRNSIVPDIDYEIGPMQQIKELKKELSDCICR